MFNSFGTKYLMHDFDPTSNKWGSVEETSSKYPNGALFDIGVGYNLSDSLRTDFAFGYRPYYKMTTSMFSHATDNGGVFTSNKSTFKQQAYNLIANIYYDFNNATKFTPFFLAGIGWERAKTKFTLGSPDMLTQSIQPDMSVAPDAVWKHSLSTKNKDNFAVNVGVGIAYKAGEQTYIDLTYKLGNVTKNTLGNFAVKDGDQIDGGFTPTYQNVKVNSKAPLYQQSLNLGVRFVF